MSVKNQTICESLLNDYNIYFYRKPLNDHPPFLFFFLRARRFWQYCFKDIDPVKYRINKKINSRGQDISSFLDD